MSILGGAEPSRAALLEMIRTRAKKVGVRWWPEVTEKILMFRQTKRETFKGRGPEKGAHEDPTTDYLDLYHAITDGNPLILGEGAVAYDDERSWSCPVFGLDRLGNPITVFVRLPRKEDCPIDITNFLLTK
jgi:hypothetical protein